ncbi:MAG: hypothetical protein DRJ52_08195 [Thermoprotei archaeon]|nr:MAG: hypothetical protein DRJ52_08195 [Thermoprotei archaeon]
MVLSVGEHARPLIKEVIIENFMSYKYARIPLTPGLNIITGPNGAGKSSILLAIAVALGQTYTERGRRLSNLIRRGEEIARVTVVVDNSPRKGRRPLPRWRYDEFYLTRYLRADGKYWHELNSRVVTKHEVGRLLKKIGLNPNNMFIIMHQNMIEEFAFLSPQEKLSLIEDATGLTGYRKAILNAMKKLEHTLREEEKVKKLMAKAEEELEKWKKRYERYLEKLALIDRRNYLIREKAWARVRDLEREVSLTEEELGKLDMKVRDLSKYLEETTREKRRILAGIAGIENKILSHNSVNLATALKSLREHWLNFSEKYAEEKLTEFKIKLTEERISELNTVLKLQRAELEKALRKAIETGERLETSRDIKDIEKELSRVEALIDSYKDVTEDVEHIYTQYREAFEKLREKAAQVAENRRKALEELNYRYSIWKNKLLELVEDVRKTFVEFLSHVDATGDVRVENIDDIEKAGIQILVGFRGSSPTVLDPYTQSGGERTTAVMCFLLALQQHIKSPFRAIDEFDVHMDPRNREEILKLLVSLAEKNPETQYLIITPGKLVGLKPGVNIIVVQNVRGVSKIGTVVSK